MLAYVSSAKATLTTAEVPLHRFSTDVNCQKLHLLSQSCKIHIRWSCVPRQIINLLSAAEVQVWDLTGFTRRDVWRGLLRVRQRCLYFRFYMVTAETDCEISCWFLVFPGKKKKLLDLQKSFLSFSNSSQLCWGDFVFSEVWTIRTAPMHWSQCMAHYSCIYLTQYISSHHLIPC